MLLLAYILAPASSYAHADYNVDDLYPLHVRIRYPVYKDRYRVHCMRVHDEHMDDVSRHRYIHKYSDFLVMMISVGLAPIILQQDRR